ncbi:RecQ family ATP-dependent DNA helicase [Flavobacteriaceae bacterium R38]|nr:RecQ family ATP-dependent DNA helicase [Flavobacteriaceae bacterium R38]
MNTPLELLQKIWGFTSFRAPQQEIIERILKGEDVLALLPTGGGKSICFQLPAMINNGICIVISPLVALMKDQVENLKQKGIKAIALTGGIKYEEVDALLDNCIYGNYKFLYLSPERLKQDLVQDRIRQMPVNLIAIDEAHCISQWGNDFRPAYRDCTILKDLFPEVPVIALTASATPKVTEDIIANLQMKHATVVKKSFARPNIIYSVLEEPDKHYRIKLLLNQFKGAAIIYVRSRKATIEISNFLNTNHITATFYHGGISSIEKDERLQLWLQNKVRVMVATNAFGMGIDKPDVQTVIHMNLPENIENYYQEAGRAGRNGELSHAILLKNESDELQVKKQFLSVLPDVAFIKLLYKKLYSYFQISYGEGEHTSHNFKFSEFCHTYQFNTILAYNGLKLLDRHSIVTFSENFDKQTTIQFIVSNHQLFSYLDTNYQLETITQAILRTYGGVFDLETKINLHLISSKTGTSEKEVEHVLRKLAKDEIINYSALNRDTQITFLLPREDEKTINTIAKDIRQYKHLKELQVKAILNYINDEEVCKSVQLLSYFGEINGDTCGTCSVCKKEKEELTAKDIKDIGKQLIQTLSKGAKTSRELSEQLPYSEKAIIHVLRLLLDYNKIKVNHKNQYTLITQ